MKKLFYILATVILLVCTACNGSFTDPGMLDQPSGNISAGVGSGSGTTTKPTTPTNVIASAQATNSIKITWSKVSGADGYNVYKSTKANGSFNNLTTVTGTSYTDNGLSANTTYYYKVSAYNSKGESSQSQSTSAKTLSNNSYTVTFNINGGTGTVQSQTKPGNSIITLPNGNGLSKTGYAFGGWNTKADGTGTNYNAGASYTIEKNVTLYAKWSSTAIGGNVGSLSGTKWVCKLYS